MLELIITPTNQLTMITENKEVIKIKVTAKNLFFLGATFKYLVNKITIEKQEKEANKK